MSASDSAFLAQIQAAIAADASGDTATAQAAIEAAHTRYLQLNRGSTTPGGLPYPSPLDPAYELADAIRRLAEAIGTAAVDTGWQPLTAASGVTLQGGQARIINRILGLQGTASRTAAWTSGQNVATLPPALTQQLTRPVSTLVTFGSGTLGIVTASNSTGTIAFAALSGTTSLTMNLNTSPFTT